LLLTSGFSATDWQSLVGNSPYGQSAAQPAVSGGEIEFRGVVVEGGVQLINLYDPTTRTSQWIPVKGQAAGLGVQSYNAASDQVQVVQGGRTLTLPLKQTRVALIQAPSANAGAAPESKAANDGAGEERRGEMRERRENGGPAQALRNLPPEAQAMIEEFRRRRANRVTGQPLNTPTQAAPAGRQP